MVRRYFFPGKDGLIFTNKPPAPIKQKIDKFCQYNAWNTLAWKEDGCLEYDTTLHGYLEGGDCFDNSYFFYNKSIEAYEKTKKAKLCELADFITKIKNCCDILTGLVGRIRRYRVSKNLIIRMKGILERGYINTNRVVKGSKRKRRVHKNANLRYLTEYEIADYNTKIADETETATTLKSNIKASAGIENMFFTLGDTPESTAKHARVLNGRFNNYADTIFLFSMLTDLIDGLDHNIYSDCLERYKEVLEVEAAERVCKKKTTQHKSTVYIGTDGGQRGVDGSVEQVIRSM